MRIAHCALAGFALVAGLAVSLRASAEEVVIVLGKQVTLTVPFAIGRMTTDGSTVLQVVVDGANRQLIVFGRKTGADRIVVRDARDRKHRIEYQVRVLDAALPPRAILEPLPGDSEIGGSLCLPVWIDVRDQFRAHRSSTKLASALTAAKDDCGIEAKDELEKARALRQKGVEKGALAHLQNAERINRKVAFDLEFLEADYSADQLDESQPSLELESLDELTASLRHLAGATTEPFGLLPNLEQFLREQGVDPDLRL
jgi:hypothetical protein